MTTKDIIEHKKNSKLKRSLIPTGSCRVEDSPREECKECKGRVECRIRVCGS